LLLDTHVWVWSLSDPGRLKPRTREQIRNQDNEIWLSPISVWELIILAEKGRLKLQIDMENLLDEAARILPAKEAPLTAEVVLATRKLRLPHRDPADLFLAATAIVFDLTLATSDARLLAVKGIPLLSA
jgi:PIN domain nuclease of toxin-antitoxin system